MVLTIFHVLIDHLQVFFREMSIQGLGPFFNQVVFLVLSCCRSSLYILDINHLSDIWFPSIFSPSVGCPFTLLIVSFDAQKFLILMKSIFFTASTLGVIARKSLPNPVLWNFSPNVSCFSFFFLLRHSWCTILYKLQVYYILIHNFWRLYSFHSYYKTLPIFLVLYNISL